MSAPELSFKKMIQVLEKTPLMFWYATCLSDDYSNKK